MASTPTVMGSTSASDEHVADDTVAKSSKVERDKAKFNEVNEWADSTSLDDVVFGDDWVQLGRTDEQ